MLSIPSTKAADIPVGLGQQFRRQAPRYAVGTLFLGAYQYCQYWFDTRISIATDAALSHQTERVVHLGIMLVGVAAFALLLRVWSRIALFNGGRIAEYELRKALLHHLFKLGPSFYQRVSVGDVMSRSTNDLMQVRMLLGFGVLNAINTIFAFVSALAVTLQISVKLTLASLATMPLLFVVMGAFTKIMFQRQRQNQEALGAMSSAVQSSISGVRVVRSFALEARESARFDKQNRQYLEVNLALARVRGIMFPIMQAITALGGVVVLLYGGTLMLEQQITSGEFLAFYRALSRLTWPLVSVGFLVSLVQRGRASYSRLKEVFETKPDIVDGPLAAPAVTKGELAVMGLSYAYGAHRVLDDVNFLLPASGSLAIVGRTGSGKSTLASLLARLLPTPRGTVFLDGQDICDLPLAAVRGTIGYVQQTPFLFSTTIGRNIGYVLEEPDTPESMERARKAAEEAQILPEIEELPDGFDTVVGERGVQLSGGQKQRVALARGLLSGPPILVLDDPLSAVDARTEQAILRAIDRQRAARSVVLITHRVAAAARCDRILMLDGGKVVEQGTHAELLRKGGLYAAFAEEQRIESELAALADSDAPPAAAAEEGAPTA